MALSEHHGLRELALFAGGGGGILGGLLLGWRTRVAVEINPYARAILLARQRDGVLGPFPIWDDVTTFDGRPWRGHIDVISGGFPCQDISAAGKGAGIGGARSGLWSEFARIIGEVEPRFVFVENSPMLASRGLGRVLGGLASMGFDARWGVLGAADAGAPHQRDRIWIVATHPDRKLIREQPIGECRGTGAAIAPDDGRTREVAHAHGNRAQEGRLRRDSSPEESSARNDGAGVPHAHSTRELQSEGGESVARGRTRDLCQALANAYEGRRERHGPLAEGEPDADAPARRETAGWWEAEPDVGRVVAKLAARVERIECLGNGQVPLCAALAWRLLSKF